MIVCEDGNELDSTIKVNNELSLSHVNVNGWTECNSKLREEIIRNVNSNIIGISETHLSGDDIIELDGYIWMGKNRKLVKKASGGVGFLIREELLNKFDIELINLESVNIMGIKLVNKQTNYKMTVYCVYLPPEGSNYCFDTERMYDELLVQIYNTVNYDMVVILGDFNACTGGLMDSCDHDEIGIRKNIDNVVNNHGKDLIEFLIESKCCIVNGRVGSNDYTLKRTTG